MSSSENSNPASVLNGHAQYAKGYVEETIGNMTGSTEWQESGKNVAQAGIDELKVMRHSFLSFIYHLSSISFSGWLEISR